MWIFTEAGILMPSLRPAHTIEEGDDRTFQIRTRRRYELDWLRDRYMEKDLGPVVILGNSDYQYRAYCTPAAWAKAMSLMSLDIDYTKFKPTTDRHVGGNALHALYNSVWSRVLDYFPTGSSYDFKPKWTGKKTKKTTKTEVWRSSRSLDICGLPTGEDEFCQRWDLHNGPCDPRATYGSM